MPEDRIFPIDDRDLPAPPNNSVPIQQIPRGIVGLSMREFDPVYYLSLYPDVLSVYGNDHVGAAKHFKEHGVNELRSPSPFFDPRYYRERYNDLSSMNGKELLGHWHQFGIREGRQGCPDFDLGFYLANHEDLARAFGNDHAAAFLHWKKHGHQERRLTAPEKRTQLVWGETRSADNTVELADGSGTICWEREQGAEELLGPGTVLKMVCKIPNLFVKQACKLVVGYVFRETEDNEWIVMECSDGSQVRIRPDPMFEGDVVINEVTARTA